MPADSLGAETAPFIALTRTKNKNREEKTTKKGVINELIDLIRDSVLSRNALKQKRGRGWEGIAQPRASGCFCFISPLCILVFTPLCFVVLLCSAASLRAFKNSATDAGRKRSTPAPIQLFLFLRNIHQRFAQRSLHNFPFCFLPFFPLFFPPPPNFGSPPSRAAQFRLEPLRVFAAVSAATSWPRCGTAAAVLDPAGSTTHARRNAEVTRARFEPL